MSIPRRRTSQSCVEMLIHAAGARCKMRSCPLESVEPSDESVGCHAPRADHHDRGSDRERCRSPHGPQPLHSDRSTTLARGGSTGNSPVINVLFILNDAPIEAGRSLNGLCLASSMSLRSSAYVRVFLLGSAAVCASRARGQREREDAALLLTT